MAALFHIRHLRRHALPAFVTRDLDHELDRRERSERWFHGGRPHLVATWRVGADGRLECTWSKTDPVRGDLDLGPRSG